MQKIILGKRDRKFVDLAICVSCNRTYKRFISRGKGSRGIIARGWNTVTCSKKCSKLHTRKQNTIRNLKNYSKKYNIKVIRLT